MCGLCGELRFDGQLPEPQRIERMKHQLQKRGPDSEGTYVNKPVAFGHRRLAIIDLSEKAAQPMVDAEADVALVFNGTIYNYPDLRKELQSLGHNFKSTGDTEVSCALISSGAKAVCNACRACSPSQSGIIKNRACY